ncbi:MAG: Eco57I restriction-modification methylase domain-containing protein [Desulfomonilaceae bacterium]
MEPLERSLRGRLERAVGQARDIAEAGARAALESLGVGNPSPFGHSSEEERELRRKLRIHGRQIGDIRDPKSQSQGIDRLVEEVAYEHWHRMLFARFLADNDLLMFPDETNPVAVTLEECEELAQDEGARNGWELASRYAAGMLPQIFRPDSPVFGLSLPPENQLGLERLLNDLQGDIFTASDSLGWVYQFWQAKNKAAINDSGTKIGEREISAVTQLFTEPYMVSFLLDNTLGAWWAARRLSEEDFHNADTEEKRRSKASLPGAPLAYLRFIKDGDGKWQPAAGSFEEWPQSLCDLKVLDPCCGSGHFLVAALSMLVPIRMELEGLTAANAVDAVLRQNLHGLEIEQRCVELAAFALALTAWRYPEAGGYRILPQLNLACSGLSVSVPKSEWQSIAQDEQRLRLALNCIYDEFEKAPLFGSLINLEKSTAAKLVEWDQLEPILHDALASAQSDEQLEMGVVAQGLAKASQIMTSKFHLVITNVPYLARGKQGEILKDFLESNFGKSKNDLATAFLERCLEFCCKGGTSAIVLPQNWLFLTTYKNLREKLLTNETLELIARVGPGAFETISGEVVKAILFVLRHGTKQDTLRLTGAKEEGSVKTEDGVGQIIRGLDVSEVKSAQGKAELLVRAEIVEVEQAKQLENPDAVIAFYDIGSKRLLDTCSTINYGSKPGQTDRVTRFFWEMARITSSKWQKLESTPSGLGHFTGKEKLCLSLNEIADQGIAEFGIRSADIWGREGIVLSQMRHMPFSIYLGKIFDNNTSVICPSNERELPAILCFLESGEYLNEVRKLNQKLDVAAHSMIKVPFDLEYWQKIAAEKYPNGLPEPYSDDPTQWIFHGHPAVSEHPLQVAVARLLGYRWPAELDDDMELSEEARYLVAECKDLESYADEDGIVCIPPVRGEAPAVDRLMNMLAASYGNDWGTNRLSEVLSAADHSGKSLETWLRDKFFIQHCKLFHHRPFIWHIWDGLSDGFSALVNYHKLDRKKLETLIYLYLGDWIKRQTEDVSAKIDGAQERRDAAEALKKKLELILEGESPYDIFVRWKPIEKQPIGWEPDINDGVRMNIRPFMSALDVKKRGAGVLRDKPNIDWKKDRGKDVESAPWFHLFKGDRINDHHLTLAAKLSARNAKEKEARS